MDTGLAVGSKAEKVNGTSVWLASNVSQLVEGLPWLSNAQAGITSWKLTWRGLRIGIPAEEEKEEVVGEKDEEAAGDDDGDADYSDDSDEGDDSDDEEEEGDDDDDDEAEERELDERELIQGRHLITFIVDHEITAATFKTRVAAAVQNLAKPPVVGIVSRTNHRSFRESGISFPKTEIYALMGAYLLVDCWLEPRMVEVKDKAREKKERLQRQKEKQQRKKEEQQKAKEKKQRKKEGKHMRQEKGQTTNGMEQGKEEKKQKEKEKEQKKKGKEQAKKEKEQRETKQKEATLKDAQKKSSNAEKSKKDKPIKLVAKKHLLGRFYKVNDRDMWWSSSSTTTSDSSESCKYFDIHDADQGHGMCEHCNKQLLQRYQGLDAFCGRPECKSSKPPGLIDNIFKTFDPTYLSDPRGDSEVDYSDFQLLPQDPDDEDISKSTLKKLCGTRTINRTTGASNRKKGMGLDRLSTKACWQSYSCKICYRFNQRIYFNRLQCRHCAHVLYKQLPKMTLEELANTNWLNVTSHQDIKAKCWVRQGVIDEPIEHDLSDTQWASDYLCLRFDFLRTTSYSFLCRRSRRYVEEKDHWQISSRRCLTWFAQLRAQPWNTSLWNVES